MHIPNLITTKKTIALTVLAVAAALLLVVGQLVSIAAASSIIRVTSNIASVPGGDSLVLTIGAQNDGDVHELEIDHSLEGTLPEFSVYADESNPYGGTTCGPDSDTDCQTAFNSMGVFVTYSAANSEWVIDFGDQVTDVIRDNGGEITFYYVLRDADNNELWGTMFGITPENSFAFDLEAGTGDSLVPDVTDDVDTEDVIVPGVPNTSVVN